MKSNMSKRIIIIIEKPTTVDYHPHLHITIIIDNLQDQQTSNIR